MVPQVRSASLWIVLLAVAALAAGFIPSVLADAASDDGGEDGSLSDPYADAETLARDAATALDDARASAAYAWAKLANGEGDREAASATVNARETARQAFAAFDAARERADDASATGIAPPRRAAAANLFPPASDTAALAARVDDELRRAANLAQDASQHAQATRLLSAAASALDAAQRTALGAARSLHDLSAPTPPCPVASAATLTPQGPRLAWSSVAAASAYRIYSVEGLRDESADSLLRFVREFPAETLTYTHAGAPPGAPARYVITAVNEDGAESSGCPTLDVLAPSALECRAATAALAPATGAPVVGTAAPGKASLLLERSSIASPASAPRGCASAQDVASATVVPAPAGLALMGVGGIAVALGWRLRKP